MKINRASFSNTRAFVPSEITSKEWKEYFKDLEWDVEVDVTGEQSDTQATMTTMTTVLQTIATNPAILQDPNAKMLFNKILNMTGAVSPIELSATNSAPEPTTPEPVVNELVTEQPNALPQ